MQKVEKKKSNDGNLVRRRACGSDLRLVDICFVIDTPDGINQTPGGINQIPDNAVLLPFVSISRIQSVVVKNLILLL